MAENKDTLILEREKEGEVARWEAIMANEGLAPITKPLTVEMNEAGLKGDSLDELSQTEFEIKNSLDSGVETENKYSSEMPLNKCGLPPCKRAKLESERGIVEKNPRLGR